MIGQTISHYKILEKLGEGGMGVVYKAEDTKLKRTVALKFITPYAVGSEAEKTRFVHEAQAAAALDHPNICTVYEIDEAEEKTFIAMAYIEGPSLKEKIESGPLKLREAVDIAIQVAQGLQAAHEKGIFHRDVKSANIVVTEKGQAKIMDFGLAEIAGRSRVTKEGMTVGTAAFMSPEQARGEKLDQRTDIWSLGVVLYEMVTGRHPFPGEYEQAILYQILNEEPEPITSLRSNVPMELERIVKKAMQKNRNERYQHVDEMVTDLVSLRKELESGMKERLIKTRIPWKNKTYLYGGVAALILALVIGLYFWQGIQQKKTGIVSGTTQASIAVLPFVNMSSDKEDEYFSDGMTEELINALAKVGGLRVASRTSAFQFKGKQQDIRTIGAQLNVASVLEGSVRKAGNKLRIAAQLINVSDGYHLWSEVYEKSFEGVFAIQDDISKRIVDALKITLRGEQGHLVKKYTDNLEAYNFYLKGRYALNRFSPESLKEAIGYFHQALAKDSTYALAYTGIGQVYLLMIGTELSSAEAYRRTKEAMNRALEIDKSLSEAHTTVALAHYYYDWDWAGTEWEFKRAIELNPNETDARHWYSHFLMGMGRYDESLKESKWLVAYDSLSGYFQAHLGWHYLWVGDLDKALPQLQKAVALDQNLWFAHQYLGWAYEQKGQYSDAERELKAALKLFGEVPWMLSNLGHLYAVSGRRAEAQQIATELMQTSSLPSFDPVAIATIYAGLGERDKTIEWLEKGFELKTLLPEYLGADPRLNPFRNDQKLLALMRKVGLPADETPRRESGAAVDENKPSTSTKWQNSIAVLPFKNISPDKEQEYFCDGMTEQLITNLTNLPNVKVIARTSVMQFKNTNKTIQQIANELGVAHVLEGSVRKSGNKIRVTAQLIKADDGFHLWAKDYDRQLKDIFAVQDDISGKITSALKLKLTPAEHQQLTAQPTKNLDAYELYLRGLYYFHRRTKVDNNTAIMMFDQAVTIDPTFALAYATLARAYTDRGFEYDPQKVWEEKASAAIEKALSIDSNLAEAYLAKGLLLWTPSNHFLHEKAVAEYRRALSLNPNLDEAHEGLGTVYNHVGLFEKLIEEENRTLEINPGNLEAQFRIGVALTRLQKYDEALAVFKKIPKDFNPTYLSSSTALTLLYLGRRGEASSLLAQRLKGFSDEPWLTSTQAILFAVNGENDKAKEKIELAIENGKGLGHFHHIEYNIAAAYALMKQNQSAIQWLEKAADDGFPCYPYFEQDPNLSNLRSDPQFLSFMEKLKKQWEYYKANL